MSDSTVDSGTGIPTDSGGASASGSTPFITLTLSPDAGLGFILDTMEATEELGRPFLITLDVSASTPQNDLHTILGSTATVSLSYPEKATRYFNGIVARVQYRGLSGGGYRYRLELRPWIWLLSRTQDCAIFSSQAPWDIITGLFRTAGFTDFADMRQNTAGSTVLDYCVQYRETTFDFVTRLMEQYGIYYFVTHANGTHTINFADDPNSHTALTDAIPYRYDQTDWRAVDDHIWDWSADAGIQPGAYTYRDYNFTTPSADLTAKSLIDGNHTYGSSEVYDYPGRYDTAANGTPVAQVRMQDFDTRRQMYGGISNSRLLGSGVKFTLSGFPDSAGNQEYLVTHSVCTVDRAETRAFQDEDEIIDTFRCTMRAVPATRPFRLPDLTPRPLIRGPQTAVVTGDSGQEITTDQYGRIKVKFPWDRSATTGENTSCWIRVAQGWAGQGWGSIFIPRIGQEVVVEFLDGNPDRPLVTGSVYNATMTVPYTLPDNMTRSTVKTNSSLGGGGFNEFRFEDKKGSEEVFFQAQKDFNETILNNHTATITQDTTTTVSQGNRVVTVSQGNDTHTVSQGNRVVTVSQGNDTRTVSQGNRSATVSAGDESLTVSQGKRTVTISTGNDGLTVTQGDLTVDVTAGTTKVTSGTKILLQVGSNTLEMTTTGITLTVSSSSIQLTESGITISGAQVQASATSSMEVSGLTTKVSGDTSLDLDGGLNATLKGAMVEIN